MKNNLEASNIHHFLFCSKSVNFIKNM